MAKFAVGQLVDNAADDHESGTVVAVFPTVDDSFRYAVDMEGYGLLQFFTKEKLDAHPARRNALEKGNGGCRDGSSRHGAISPPSRSGRDDRRAGYAGRPVGPRQEGVNGADVETRGVGGDLIALSDHIAD